jgi:NAD-dependent dihydropyrimidine dehydrogenase PreA subunit
VSRLRSQRELFPWFPTINSAVCLADLECVNFCPADVFDWDPATGKPVVARPFDCIPGCLSCAENCKAKGISLPGKKEVTAALKRIRAENGLPSPRGKRKGSGSDGAVLAVLPSPGGEGKGWGRATPQGSDKTRAKGFKCKSRNPGSPSAFRPMARGNKATE